MSAVYEMHEEGVEGLRRAPSVMKEILDDAAARVLAEKTYRDRTHNLRESTSASEVMVAGDEAVVVFGAREPYASFVENRGFSDVEGKAAEADIEIQYALEGEVERLANM
jgi:hypothetical protein